MIEHPLTPFLVDLLGTLSDLRAGEYESPTTPDERRAIAWTLYALDNYPEVAEAFHRAQFTGGDE